VVGLFVCDDAFTYDTASPDALAALHPTLVVIPWGITAGSQADCGKEGFNATGFAGKAAAYLKTAYVIGANATGERTFGRFLPSWYCGTSGFAKPNGDIGGILNDQDEMGVFD
jgi:N-carbamoylputrescine amidase